MRALDLVMAAALAIAATPALAQLRPLVDPPATAEAARGGVDVYLVNEGASAQPVAGPDEIETIAKDGTRLRLIAAPDGAATVAPGGFARMHYRLAASYPAPIMAAAVPPSPATAAGETVTNDSSGKSSAFIDRFRTHEPIYGVAGTGAAGAKLQVSLDFRLFGHDDTPHLDFGYTQTMFWAINRPSGPFRATNYSPEVFADLPIGDTADIGLGYRHDSNGGGVTDSVDSNRLVLCVTKDFALGRAWHLSVTPQGWVYVGGHGNAVNFEGYWGNAGLAASIGQRDGVKLAVSGRGNFSSGRGGAEAFLSYPLARISTQLPHIYLFGQGFTGFGEALSDYNRRTTSLRIGIALTR